MRLRRALRLAARPLRPAALLADSATVAAPPLHGQGRQRAESGALPPSAPVRPPPPTTPNGAVAPGKSSEQVRQYPPNSSTGCGPNQTDAQTARATLFSGVASNLRGVDPMFAHHVAQSLASLCFAALPLQPVFPAVLPWPHRPTQPLASLLVTPVLGVPTNNDAAHAALRRGLLDPPAPTAAPTRAFMRPPAPPKAPPLGEPPVMTGV